MFLGKKPLYALITFDEERPDIARFWMYSDHLNEHSSDIPDKRISYKPFKDFLEANDPELLEQVD